MVKKVNTAKLIEMYNLPMPAEKIAAHFGVHVTTIYGHVGQLVQRGLLTSRKKDTQRPNRGLKITKSRTNTTIMHKSRSSVSCEMKHTTPLGKPVTIMELTNNTCRWPCAGSMFCGAEVSNRGYCKEHYSVSIQDKGNDDGEI